MSDNIFAVATRQQLRWPSPRGLLNVEQLWELPLKSKTGLDLDSIAKTVNAAVKADTEESFVDASPAASTKLRTMLEVVKYMIAEKKAEIAAAVAAEDRRRERDKIRAIIDRKTDQALESESLEALTARLQQLGG